MWFIIFTQFNINKSVRTSSDLINILVVLLLLLVLVVEGRWRKDTTMGMVAEERI